MYNKISIFGDVHGNFNLYNNKLNELSPELSIVCGDFGIWPKWKNVTMGGGFKYSLEYLKKSPCVTYFVDGNHEDFDCLNEKYGKHYTFPSQYPSSVYNIKHMRRGTILKINDLTFLFMGGAESIDKMHRIEGVSWFRDESLSFTDIDTALEKITSDNINIDVVISHCAPMEFDIVKFNDYDNTSRKSLSGLLEYINPRLWVFGHYHMYKEGTYKDCKWVGLDEICSEKCSIMLEDWI